MKTKIMSKPRKGDSVRSKKGLFPTNIRKPVLELPGKAKKSSRKVKKIKTDALVSTVEKQEIEEQRINYVVASTVEKEVIEDKHTNYVMAPKQLVPANQLESAVNALFQYIQKKSDTENALFDEEKPIFLQITSVKVPKTPIRILRLNIPHTLLTESSEVCLIVRDVGKPKEHEETIEHYEELLKKHDITNIKTILPYHQFKTEYGNEFELKRTLLGLYDCFLVDSTISGYVTHLLGKIFMKKRMMPASIKMYVPHLKSHIEKTLKKTSLKLHPNSDSFIVQVGHTKMLETQVSENISEVIDQLGCHFPGGEDNIRALSIKTDKSIAVPIYLTLRNKNDIPVAVVQSKRPKHYKLVRDELSTYLNRDISILPDGDVMVHTRNESYEIEDEDMED